MPQKLFPLLKKRLLPESKSPDTIMDVTLWYPVRLLALYRLFIAILLASFFFTDFANSTLGAANNDLFSLCIFIYILLAITWLALSRIRKPHYEIQIYTQLIADITLLVLMASASNGFSGGLGILIIVTVGSAVALLKGLAGFFFAALASILILITQLYSHLSTGNPTDSYSQIGALGLACFGVAALMLILKHRLHISEQLAEQRGLDIANLAQLNEQIIQQMQSGVVVIDNKREVRLINHAAIMQLNITNCRPPVPLAETSKELSVRHNLWVNSPEEKCSRIRSPGSPFELQPHFTPLGTQGRAGTLIILEDTTPYSREFQNIKLASLGRLTASIAHEIRNPLSAIQHASQLLEESPSLDDNDKRLTEIINQQTVRMNTIIENIMQLSRREDIHPTTIALDKWLYDFKQEFTTHNHISAEDITLQPNNEDCTAFFDPTQLHQVIWNLCRNSLKYGSDDNNHVKIDITYGINKNLNSAYLEIADHGKGVDSAIQDKIFEPFYSSSNSSPGLGLYIIRELCEFNQAQIRYIDHGPNKGAKFRIQFASPIQIDKAYQDTVTQ